MSLEVANSYITDTNLTYLITKMTLIILSKNQMKEIFNETIYKADSVACNKSTRNFQTKSRVLLLINNEIENLTPNVISYKSNFTQEYSVLQSFKGHQDIVLKTPDKAGGWVIKDKKYHRDKIVKEHLLSNVR